MAGLKSLVSGLPMPDSRANLIGNYVSGNVGNVQRSSEVSVIETHTSYQASLSVPDIDPVSSTEKGAEPHTEKFFSSTTEEWSVDSDDSMFSSAPFPVSDTTGWSVEEVFGVVVVIVIVPFILVSNLMVIISVFRFKRLQMPTNYFIVSLAAVDIFVAIVAPSFIIMETLPGRVENMVLCLTPNRILMTACGVSVLTLAAIAYDRHTALIHPLKYVSVMTIRKIAVVVAFTWLYSAVIVWAPLPLGWFSTISASSPSGSHTHVQPCSLQLFHDYAHILFLCAIFGPACLAITVCYCRIYAVARHHAKAIAAVENSVHHNVRVRFMIRDAKYAKTLALVIGVFLFLWMPYLVFLLAEVISQIHVSPWLWNYLTLLAVLNSGVNPWIYAFKNNEFRTAFRKLFKAFCKMCRKSICLRMHTESRRSSSETNAYVTTTTIMSHSRVSRLSHGSATPIGRMSVASCVVNMDDSDKVLSSRPEEASTKDCQSGLPSTLTSNGLLRSSLSKLTEQRVSTLLNTDSRAFIADLLTLYLHHSLTDKDMGSVCQVEAQGQDTNDESNHYCSECSEHTEHSFLSEHSNYSQTDHSDQTEQGYYSDITGHSCQSEHSDRGYHSDQTECSDNTGCNSSVHRASSTRNDPSCRNNCSEHDNMQIRQTVEGVYASHCEHSDIDISSISEDSYHSYNSDYDCDSFYLCAEPSLRHDTKTVEKAMNKLSFRHHSKPVKSSVSKLSFKHHSKAVDNSVSGWSSHGRRVYRHQTL